MKKGFTLVILSTILFPSSLWGLAWYFSAQQLASEHCMGEFSLFHQDMICREPSLIIYLSTLLAFFSIFILFLGVKFIRHSNK